jgi:hypothetical protein
VVLYNNGFLPRPIYLTLVVIIALIGFYFLFTTFYSMMRRDNMNYQEYNWQFNPNKNDASLATTNSPSVDPWSGQTSSVCVGAQCCNQYEYYDPNLNQCIVTSNSCSNTNSTSGTDLNVSVNNELSSLGKSVSNAYGNISSGITNQFSTIF